MTQLVSPIYICAPDIEASIFEYDEEKEMMVDKWRCECLSIGIIIQT